MAEDPSEDPDQREARSALVIHLLKGVLYREDDPNLWNTLIQLQAEVRDTLEVLALDLILDEGEGYAFLRAIPDDQGATPRPRLIARRPLSFPVSLILALLRKKLAELDASGSETRLVLSREEIVELIRVFLPETTHEVKLIDQLEVHLNKIVELGFLRKLKTSSPALSSSQASFEVRRILKAFVDAQWLADFDGQLAAYQASFSREEASDV
jgi:hypothetical protein